MDALVQPIQDVVVTEPETGAQPDPTQTFDTIIETQLAQEIRTLWMENTRLSADSKATSRELRQIRASLAERLYEMKTLLCQPGRGGQWRGWLQERAIPRSTADRLVSRHADTLCNHEGDAPSEAISNSPDDSAEKVAKDVWLRIGNLLSTDESVIRFIVRFVELAGVGHEQRAEGLLIFRLVPAPAIDPVPQSSDEAPEIVDEPEDETAAAPPELDLAVAAVGTNSGHVE